MTQLQNMTIVALLEEGYRPNNWMAVLFNAAVIEKKGQYCVFFNNGTIALYLTKADLMFKTYNTRE